MVSVYYGTGISNLKALERGIYFGTNTTWLVSPPSSLPTDTNPLNMTIVLNDPFLWPEISFTRALSYFDGSWRVTPLTQPLTVVSQLHL
jgi:hypothetical protein